MATPASRSTGAAVNWRIRNPASPERTGAPLIPTQKHVSHYFRLTPDDKTAETVYSPRNNNWFILTLATRRGLTFLEQQAVVDADRLGRLWPLHGRDDHRAGGGARFTRIKAAVPSCGGAGITQAENIARSWCLR